MVVNFKVAEKNSGQIKSELLPIRLETTDWFDTTPLLVKSSWDGTYYNSSTSTDIEGPAVLAGKSRVLSWSVFLQSPFDTHYTLDVGEEHWELWTSNKICF